MKMLLQPCKVRPFDCFSFREDEFPVPSRIKTFIWVKNKEKVKDNKSCYFI